MRHAFRSLPHLFACVILLAFCASCSQKPAPAPPGPPTPMPAGPAEAAKPTALVIHLPDDQPSKVWEVEAGAELTVKELMDALQDAQFTFQDTLYPGMGHLVTSIMGQRNAAGDGAYWQFCIDNVASDRGIDEKRVAPGHQVDWHYAKYGELPCKKIGE